MKIAMICGSYPPQPCGIGDYTARLVSELRRSGLDLEVITTASGGREATDVVTFELKNWSVRSWYFTIRRMKTRQYDVIHIQYPARFYGYRPSLALLSILLKLMIPRVPIVVTLHEFRITHFLRKLTVAAIVAPASALLLTAGSEREAIARWLPWLVKKTRVVTMATTIPEITVTDERRTELRLSYGLRQADMLVVYFGLLHPNKGIEKLLDAFQLLHGRIPATRLLMLSLFDPASNAYHENLQTRVASLGIQHVVLWPGFLPPREVSERLGMADVGFFPFEDGVTLRRLSFMTAMSHGLPILTTVGHAGSDLLGLRDGENVLLVNSHASPTDMSAGLMQLTSSKDLRDRLRTGARAWSSTFAWESVVKSMLEVYRSIAPGRTG